MKSLILLLFVTFTSMSAFGAIEVSELKIDNNWKVKYKKKNWTYLYLKPMGAITPHVLESKRSGLRVILQKESHVKSNTSLDKLVKNKCNEADSFYKKQRNGSALLETISNKPVCYIEYKNSMNNIISLYVFPEINKKANYELYTFSWQSSGLENKKEVSELIAESLK